MPVVTLIAPGSATWPVPADCPPGTAVTAETWGAGSGASGRVGSTFGAAGAGGAYASSLYIITPHDASNGVPYIIGAGTAGLSGANPAAGGSTSFSQNVNLIRNSTNTGAVIPSTFPTNWVVGGGGGLTITIVKFGTVSASGNPYIQVRLVGTTATDARTVFNFDSAIPAVAATAYAFSFGAAVIAGTQANITGFVLGMDDFSDANANTYIGTPIFHSITLTSAMTVFQSTGTSDALTLSAVPYLEIDYALGAVIDITLQLEAMQVETGSALTFFRSTPGYTFAAGGGAPSGTTGGVGATTAASFGTTLFAGGSGAAFNANGSGGGGSGGKDGAGVAGGITGQGGAGDNSSGGAGGAVKTTTPGNSGTANVEGGGGGGGLKTVAGTGGAGAAPGGGGGGAAVATGTGGTGARGQIRLTYASQLIPGLARPALLQIWDH